MWLYMCDECDIAGIWKPDYELTSYILDFNVTAKDLQDWYGNKIFLFEDKVLIVQFFQFQYETVKDSWSAKRKAQQILESYGFVIKNNKLDDSIPQWGYSGDTVHINININNTVITEGNDRNDQLLDYDFLIGLYPKRKGDINRQGALRNLKQKIKNESDFKKAISAINNYKKFCVAENKIGTELVMQASTFFGRDNRWLEYVEQDKQKNNIVIGEDFFK